MATSHGVPACARRFTVCSRRDRVWREAAAGRSQKGTPPMSITMSITTTTGDSWSITLPPDAQARLALDGDLGVAVEALLSAEASASLCDDIAGRLLQLCGEVSDRDQWVDAAAELALAHSRLITAFVGIQSALGRMPQVVSTRG